MDIAPATRGHALVIPRVHTRDLLSIAAEDLAGGRRSPPSGWPRGSSERLGADGVNLLNSCGAAAWQTVFHFHIHVIPRYKGDPLRLPWMPQPGDPSEIAAAAQELTGDSEIVKPLHLAASRVEWQMMKRIHIALLASLALALALPAVAPATLAEVGVIRRRPLPKPSPAARQPVPGRQPHDRLPGQGRLRRTTR